MSILRDLSRLAIFAVLVFVLFQVALPRHLIQGPSMAPTLHAGDRIFRIPSFFERLRFYDDELYDRGDIVIFDAPPDYYNFATKIEDEDFIKRIVGVPGDVVDIRAGSVYVNDVIYRVPMAEYTPLPMVDTDIVYPYRVPADSYFVLGDNRVVSSDSRYWGVVQEDTISGKVLARYWPFMSFELFY